MSAETTELKLANTGRQVLAAAVESAIDLGHFFVSTEHLLVGVARVDDRILRSFGVTPERIVGQVESVAGRSSRPFLVGTEIKLAPRAEEVLALAAAEARRFKSREIDGQHILSALAREGDGIAGGILESMGISLDQIRREISRHSIPTEPENITGYVTSPADKAALLAASVERTLQQANSILGKV